MDRKHRKFRMNVFARVLKMALFLLLAYAAIRIGVAGGNALTDININIVRNIHVESFKSTLNASLPLIDTVYNSGNMDVSFAGEIQRLVSRIFQFDLDNPITILNAQSPVLYSFYNKEYQEYLAKVEQEEQAKRNQENGTQNNDNNNPDDKIADNTPTTEETTPQYKVDDSSIYYPGDGEDVNDDEKRDRSDENIVSNGKIAINIQRSNQKIDDALISKLLKEPFKFKFDKKGPQILVFHTHTTESYIKNLDELKKKGVSRTTDNRYNVVRVGEELSQYLRKRYGFNVMHNGAINDEDYNDAYITARKNVTNILKGNQSIKVLIDLHRDAVDDEKLRPVAKVNGKNVAQVMFVLGIKHPEWKENFKLALKLQEKLNAQYPGLARPIILRGDAKFNQHLSNGALIIEVGGEGNTVQEAVASTEYLAKALNDVLGGLK